MNAYMPWSESKKSFCYRPGEVTLYAGSSGHGKSKIMTQVAGCLAGEKQRVFFISLETSPVNVMERMFRSQTDLCNPSNRDLLNTDWSAHQVEPVLTFVNTKGGLSEDEILANCCFAGERKLAGHIFIDSLVRCVDGGFAEKQKFISQLCAVAKKYGVHVHISAHFVKSYNEKEKPKISDIRYSDAIAYQVDNLLLIWRNKPKEESAKEGKKDRLREPDQVIYCRKQRNAFSSENSEPTILLWLHKDSGQFLERDGAPVMFFPNWPHVSSF